VPSKHVPVGVRVTPEIRTRPATAIAICVGALFSIAIAAFASPQLEKLLGSEAAATGILVGWCVLGCGAAIAAIVDAYIKPEGERLGLATTIAATLFAILALAVIAGIVAGAADLGKSDVESLESAVEGKKRSG
jgi:drug/metabolite transporter (DMT)-like permease